MKKTKNRQAGKNIKKTRKENSLIREISHDVRDSVIFSVIAEIILWVPRILVRMIKNLF